MVRNQYSFKKRQKELAKKKKKEEKLQRRLEKRDADTNDEQGDTVDPVSGS